MRKNAEKRKRDQKSISKIKFEIGDQVLLRVPHISSALDKTVKKFFHLYEGPYRINKIINSNAFELCEIDNYTKVKGIYNRQSLKKYCKSDETQA
jgi:hypothetical protein